jgi:hypothetical protein
VERRDSTPRGRGRLRSLRAAVPAHPAPPLLSPGAGSGHGPRSRHDPGSPRLWSPAALQSARGRVRDSRGPPREGGEGRGRVPARGGAPAATETAADREEGGPLRKYQRVPTLRLERPLWLREGLPLEAGNVTIL